MVENQTESKAKCPHCDSGQCRKFGWLILSGRKAQKYQCISCGRVFRSPKTVPL